MGRHVAAGIMVKVLKIYTVKSEFRKGKSEKFCEGRNQFCKVRQFTSLCKICNFPLLQWLGEKILSVLVFEVLEHFPYFLIISTET